jgi:hypothetical protein
VLQRLPDALLEGSPLQVERQVQSASWRLDEADDPRHHVLEVAVGADQHRSGELVLQLAQEAVCIVTEQDRADPFQGRSDQNGAQAALAHGEADFRIPAPRPIIARRHPEDSVGGGVKAPVGLEAGVIDRRSDRRGLNELTTDALGPMGRDIGLRGHTRD